MRDGLQFRGGPLSQKVSSQRKISQARAAFKKAPENNIVMHFFAWLSSCLYVKHFCNNMFFFLRFGRILLAAEAAGRLSGFECTAAKV